MSLLTYIQIDPAVCGGEPSVKSYSVRSLLGLLQAGHTYEEILAHYEDLWDEHLLAVEGYASALQYQGSISLGELIERARPCFVEQMGDDWALSLVYQRLHCNSPLNAHLKMRHGRFFHYVEPRESPLSPDARVFGQFLTLDWRGHDGFLLLTNYISREEMKYEIGGGGGICNGYITSLAAFENGELLPYRAHYTDLHGARKVLDKQHEERFPEGWEEYSELYNDVEIEWLRRIAR